ncbi:hypothetical protein V8F33_006210, partial [Rhypophila sp. PSN 637]
NDSAKKPPSLSWTVPFALLSGSSGRDFLPRSLCKFKSIGHSRFSIQPSSKISSIPLAIMETGKDQADCEVSEAAVAFMAKKNRQRLEIAKKLLLDFNRLSISDKTGLILFHGATDEQLDSEYERYETYGDITYGAYKNVRFKDISMWFKFLDTVPEEKYRRRLEMDDLIDIAKAIRKSWKHSRHFPPVARLYVKKAMENAHMRFVNIAYPVDAVISVLEGMENTPECYDFNSSANGHASTERFRFNESNGTGLVTIGILRQALCAFNPYAKEEDGAWEEKWEEEIEYKVITPLRRYIGGGFGYYPEAKKDYMYPGHDLWPEVEAQLSYHKNPATTQASENEDSATGDGKTNDSDSSSDEEDDSESDSRRTSKKREVGDA